MHTVIDAAQNCLVAEYRTVSGHVPHIYLLSQLLYAIIIDGLGYATGYLEAFHSLAA